ncbi:MAG: hypothetical protein ACW99A_03185 [Candidatus Kariarchaeaceae archaeon]|jgi:hypothetical protein
MITGTKSPTNGHPVTHDYPLSMRSGKMERLLRYSLVDLNRISFNIHKRKLLQLADHARLNKIQIHFLGKEDMMKGVNPDCENELFKILADIESQSILSPRKYNIKLVY